MDHIWAKKSHLSHFWLPSEQRLSTSKGYKFHCLFDPELGYISQNNVAIYNRPQLVLENAN